MEMLPPSSGRQRRSRTHDELRPGNSYRDHNPPRSARPNPHERSFHSSGNQQGGSRINLRDDARDPRRDTRSDTRGNTRSNPPNGPSNPPADTSRGASASASEIAIRRRPRGGRRVRKRREAAIARARNGAASAADNDAQMPDAEPSARHSSLPPADTSDMVQILAIMHHNASGAGPPVPFPQRLQGLLQQQQQALGIISPRAANPFDRSPSNTFGAPPPAAQDALSATAQAPAISADVYPSLVAYQNQANAEFIHALSLSRRYRADNSYGSGDRSSQQGFPAAAPIMEQGMPAQAMQRGIPARAIQQGIQIPAVRTAQQPLPPLVANPPRPAVWGISDVPIRPIYEPSEEDMEDFE